MKKIGNYKFARFLLFLSLIVSVNNILASDLPQEITEQVEKYRHRVAELNREVVKVEGEYVRALKKYTDEQNCDNHARLETLRTSRNQLIQERQDLKDRIEMLYNSTRHY